MSSDKSTPDKSNMTTPGLIYEVFLTSKAGKTWLIILGVLALLGFGFYKYLELPRAPAPKQETEINNHPNGYSLAVSGPTPTSWRIDAGDIVTIEAGGSIYVGRVLGNCGPEGMANGPFGMPITGYNIVRNINHGALLYMLSGDLDWKMAGRYVRFTAAKSGLLILDVNDNKQQDNTGAFNVRVTVEKGAP